MLYFPANLLPIMNTSSLFGAQNDTILSGVIYLWTTGSWATSLVVFIASIAVPVIKLLVLTFLVITVQRKSTWRPQLRARMYAMVSFVGRWSMLDIFVVALLTTVVQLTALASVRPGPGALAFGAVVVLTMAATRAFDPRLLWDPVEKKREQSAAA